MANSIQEINAGGVNGTGKGVVNTNSKDFIGLRKTIEEHAQNQSIEDRLKYDLISLKFQMETYVSEKEPSRIIETGQFLKNHLKVIKVKNKTFATFLEIKESNLSSIISGKRKVSLDLALKLGQVFDIDPNLWLLIQSKNELLRVDKKLKTGYQKYRLEELLKKVG